MKNHCIIFGFILQRTEFLMVEELMNAKLPEIAQVRAQIVI